MSKPLGSLFQRRVRVPFGWNDPDIKATVAHQEGERWTVNMDVAEGAMPKLAEHALDQALKHIAYDLAPEVQRVATEFLHNPENRIWIVAFIKGEIKRCVAEYMDAILPKPAPRNPGEPRR